MHFLMSILLDLWDMNTIVAVSVGSIYVYYYIEVQWAFLILIRNDNQSNITRLYGFFVFCLKTSVK